ncbi:sulfotransferase [Sphingosinicella sp. BN140058]|uniref:sulfotransferase family protein n=1 Tax=Sphingosinicella sp. BN140058 TaxID=1892855 RepID=UPI0013EAC970|nr:sulfotransferase [Sphingosinicella sp. BN140058]
MSTIHRLNHALERAWARGLLPEPPFERALARWSAEGDPSWTEPLAILVQSLIEEADLNPLGRTMAYGQIARAVAARRRADALWRTRFEIADIRIEAPIVILGQMRSGTTRVHRLLACDPRFRFTRFYETMAPVPPRGPDLRPLAAAAGLRFVHHLNPDLKAVHPTTAAAPEEEFGLFSPSIHGAQFEAQWRVPSFTRWWEQVDRRPVYATFGKLMKILAWSRAGSGPWLMKAPQFMEDLDLLLEQFPDARLICLDRDPAEVAGSSASLVWNQMKVQSDSADAAWIGAEWLRKTARRADRSAAVRAARPDVPQIEISFDAMNQDWRGAVARIYDFLDLPLTSAVEAAMARYLAEAERSGFRGHRYSLADFGLDAESVRNVVGASAAYAL